MYIGALLFLTLTGTDQLMRDAYGNTGGDIYKNWSDQHFESSNYSARCIAVWWQKVKAAHAPCSDTAVVETAHSLVRYF